MHLMISRKSRGFFCCILTASAALYAQAPTASPISGAISGTVVNRTGNAPLRRAVVTLSTVESQPQDAVAWTDAAGRFSFSYLPAGRYQLRAIKDGFQGVAFGSESRNGPPGIITLAAGENRADIQLRLSPVSVISGMVVDDAGDPIPFAQVQALTPGFLRQKRTPLPGFTSHTDSSGYYRIPNLMPGKYVLLAQAQQPTIVPQSEVSAGQVQEPRMFGSQYYPGTDRADAATLVNVEQGKSAEQINFRLLRFGRPVSLQGRVSVPPDVTLSGPPRGGSPAVGSIRLLLRNKDVGPRIQAGTEAVGPEYDFHFPNLQPGKYVLTAQASSTEKQYQASQEVDLGGEGVSGITLTMEPAIELKGKVTLEGPNAAKYSISTVTLTPGDPMAQQMGKRPQAAVNKDGTFIISNLLPGVWDIDAGPIPPDSYFKSMRLGTQDVLTEEMVITSKTSSPLNIVISTQAAAVEGDVVKGKDEPSRAIVLLAPDGKFQNVTSFYRFTTSDEKGHYKMKGLTPGKYRLYTFEELDPNYVQDPESLLKPLERLSVAIELKEGQPATQNLTLTPPVALPNAGGNQ
jgi:hypothetical protein